MKRSEEHQTVLEVLKKILPKRERWRLNALEIIAELNRPITSYEIANRLNKLGLKTRASTVHPFLDVLIEAGLCKREKDWEKYGQRGFKGVEISDKGNKIIEVLKTSVHNSLLDK